MGWGMAGSPGMAWSGKKHEEPKADKASEQAKKTVPAKPSADAMLAMQVIRDIYGVSKQVKPGKLRLGWEAAKISMGFDTSLRKDDAGSLVGKLSETDILHRMEFAQGRIEKAGKDASFPRIEAIGPDGKKATLSNYDTYSRFAESWVSQLRPEVVQGPPEAYGPPAPASAAEKGGARAISEAPDRAYRQADTLINASLSGGKGGHLQYTNKASGMSFGKAADYVKMINEEGGWDYEPGKRSNSALTGAGSTAYGALEAVMYRLGEFNGTEAFIRACDIAVSRGDKASDFYLYLDEVKFKYYEPSLGKVTSTSGRFVQGEFFAWMTEKGRRLPMKMTFEMSRDDKLNDIDIAVNHIEGAFRGGKLSKDDRDLYVSELKEIQEKMRGLKQGQDRELAEQYDEFTARWSSIEAQIGGAAPKVTEPAPAQPEGKEEVKTEEVQTRISSMTGYVLGRQPDGKAFNETLAYRPKIARDMYGQKYPEGLGLLDSALEKNKMSTTGLPNVEYYLSMVALGIAQEEGMAFLSSEKELKRDDLGGKLEEGPWHLSKEAMETKTYQSMSERHRNRLQALMRDGDLYSKHVILDGKKVRVIDALEQIEYEMKNGVRIGEAAPAAREEETASVTQGSGVQPKIGEKPAISELGAQNLAQREGQQAGTAVTETAPATALNEEDAVETEKKILTVYFGTDSSTASEEQIAAFDEFNTRLEKLSQEQYNALLARLAKYFTDLESAGIAPTQRELEITVDSILKE